MKNVSMIELNNMGLVAVLEESLGINKSAGYVVSWDKKTHIVDLKIPRFIDEIPILKIGSFDNCSSLKNVIIPKPIRIISDYAFANCSRLTNVSLSNSIIDIGKSAFWLTAIKKIILPQKIEKLRDGVFASCEFLEDINIPNSIVEIEDFAFWNCKSLKKINLPPTLKYIGNYAFRFCDELTNIKIGPSVHIKANSFLYCKSLKSIICDISKDHLKGLIVNKDKSYWAYSISWDEKTPIVDVIIPSHINGVPVTSINDKAFKYCTSLKNIIITENVTDIGDSAFMCCENLESVTILGNLKSIENKAFFNCKLLSNLDIKKCSKISDNAFENTNLKSFE